MPSLNSDARFFGLDLKDLGRQLREPWEGASAWPVLSWLSPSVPVRVLLANGREVVWLDGREATESPDAATPSGADEANGAGFFAVDIPEDMVLRRSVRLPAMGAADRHGALALEARTASPFAPVDLVWGTSPDPAHSGLHTLVMASRKQLLQYLGTLTARLPPDATPEIWVLAGGAQPVVLAGFGEARRLDFIARGRRTGSLLLASAAVLALCIAVTPSIQLKLRADQAQAAYTRLTQSAAPVVAKREALVQSADHLTALQQRLAERIEPLRLLEALTRLMPDDTALQSFKLSGTKVTVAGFTANAATLMQLLGNQPGMRDVRAPSPATRLAGADKESFVIEFVADPAHFGVPAGEPGGDTMPSAPPVTAQQAESAQSGSGAASTSAVGGAPLPGNAQSTSGATPVPGPVSSAPPAVKPASPAPGGAAFGGTATFGGTAPRPPRPVPGVPPKGSAP